MNKMQEALDHMAGVCYEAGERDTENGSGYWQAMKDSSVVSAEAAVLALFAEQQKVADELAEALGEGHRFFPCYGCYCKGKTPAECVSERGCTLAEDWQRIAGLADTALAAYNKAKEG